MDERDDFYNSKIDWPDHWFRAATIDGRPWVFYMTDAFIDECVKAIEQTIEAIGAFAKELKGSPISRPVSSE